MKRRLTAVWVIALVLTAAFSSVHAQTDWDSFEAGWVYVTLAQQTSSGAEVEFRDAYRVLPAFGQNGVQIIYYEEGTEYLLTAEDAYLLKEALAFLGETASGEQRQMNGRGWKAFTFNEGDIVIGQIELMGEQGNTAHHILIPVDQMPEFALAIENALNALG